MSVPISRLLLLASSVGLASCATSERPVITTPEARRAIEVQILGLNDFHGNLEVPPGQIDIHQGAGAAPVRAGGAAQLAATLQRLRAGRQSVTVAAGDLIGATPLASAYFLDEPAIRALTMAGLEIAAVGNHEFDKGSAELLRMQNGGCAKHTTRVPCRLEPFAGAGFQYLAANVFKADRSTTLLPPTAIKQLGPFRIGFIGMTLRETATLVTPAGVAGLWFGDEAATANALVPRLKAEGADAIVVLIHQGGRVPAIYRTQGCDGLSGDLMPILDRLDPAIDVVVSGHTHHSYACQLSVAGRQLTVTSAGKNGYLVSDIRLTFDPATRRLLRAAAENVPVVAPAEDPEVAALVSRYVAAAKPAAERPVGRLATPALRDSEDGESAAARLIADAQLAATRASDRGGADIAFINTTGVRTDLKPRADGTVSYGDIFAMQPFGNNLVVKQLTGAHLKEVLEQQFRTVNGETKIGSLLAPSVGFRFVYDLRRPEGQRIVGMTLNGRPIDPARNYRVTINNFLASGGDGFSSFARASVIFDAGPDLDALEAWLATNPTVPEQPRVTAAA